MSYHYRTPKVKVCEQCKEKYIDVSNRKQRRFCNLKCSGKNETQSRLDNDIKYRAEEKKMWKRYWYYYSRGIRNQDQIVDPKEAYNFGECKKLLYTWIFKSYFEEKGSKR